MLPAKNIEDGHYELQVPLLQIYQGTSFSKTCLNGLNALSGVGIVSIAYALSKGGWLSFFFLLLMAAVCCYTGILLQRCMDSKRGIRTYPDIGELAFGFMGRLVVASFLYLELYLLAVEFLILEGDNLFKLLPNSSSLDLGTMKLQGGKLYMLIVALIIMPTTWLKNLNSLALISTGGVISSFLLVASVLWLGIFDKVGFHEKRSLINLSGLPTSMSLYTFSFCGHGLFPTIFSSMEDKRHFSKVLIICFGLCTLNYGSMAIVGYLMYGEGLESQITLNLPMGKVASWVAIGMTLLNPVTKYALVVSPLATMIEDRFAYSNRTFSSTITRTLIVFSTLATGLFVPFFGYIMAFIGSCAGVAVSILLPCLCYLKVFGTSQISRTEMFFLGLIIMLGIMIGIIGTYSSVSEILKSF